VTNEPTRALTRPALSQPVQPPRPARGEMTGTFYGKAQDPLEPGGQKMQRIEDEAIRAPVGMRVQSSAEQFRRFKVDRDNDRPLEFDGKILARVEESTYDGLVVTRAALYFTRAGKFVTEFTRFETSGSTWGANMRRPMTFAKAQVSSSRDVALNWFRPGGRITKLLLEQLGELESEFIE
jgi:hypothetical protein